ncbi:hypothetical protein F8M41_024068 [Gigaspora margarita]|uniref:Uncharacterized protein n=1 Tax=Gigaspora margarita TaxID=4874 RepID=A0A8H4EFH1_GIGMA|nr:hypothetical protein F8M41_024068 [Gigaspora margarita]
MKVILTRTSNKFEALYGEVACGLCPLGMSLASQKKKYLDKVKLAELMRGSLNCILKKLKHLNAEQRKKLIVYGWTFAGLDLSLYGMDWAGNGMYRFGLIDSCSLPSNKEIVHYSKVPFAFERIGGMWIALFLLLLINLLTFNSTGFVQRKLTETQEEIQILHYENIRGKCRQKN